MLCKGLKEFVSGICFIMAEPYHGNSLFVMVAVRQFVAHRGLMTEKKICGSVKVMVWSLIDGFDIFVSDKNKSQVSPHCI